MTATNNAIIANGDACRPIARRRLRLPMPVVRILLVLLAFASPLSMAGGAVAGPFEDAQAAHGRSDYATALRLWRPLADQGNAEAQYALGFMIDVRTRRYCCVASFFTIGSQRA